MAKPEKDGKEISSGKTQDVASQTASVEKVEREPIAPPPVAVAKSKTNPMVWFGVGSACAVLVAGIGGFLLGSNFAGKSTDSNSSATRSPDGAMGENIGGGMGREMGSMGTVTEITDTRITIKNTRQNTTTTYTINDSTTFTKSDRTEGDASDIAVGDSVMIQTDSDATDDDDSAKVATQISEIAQRSAN